MLFNQTDLPGAYVIGLEPIGDERGFFARAWCHREFEAHRLANRTAQVNISFNLKRGTLRGLHFQADPHEEVKIVRCTRGAVYDVIIDLRPRSETFG
ncbi:MAG: dTDP-4-dehydrorhamnose 3,5-epimerase family protein, partial [Candidatus Binatia bacterium]